MAATKLSDKALAVFAFAIYHQLATGERVTSVTREDRAGHRADPDAVAELEAAALVKADADRLVLTEEGRNLLATLTSGLHELVAGRS